MEARNENGFWVLTWPVMGWQILVLYHIMLYRVHLAWAGFELTTLEMIGTDCIGSHKSNYHMIMTTTTPSLYRWFCQSHWAWNKGYCRYSYVCFIPWHTPQNWQYGPVKNITLRKKRWFQFSHCEPSIIRSNITAAPAYGVYMYISQLIRYSRDCSSYHDFLDRGLLLIRKLLDQGFLVVKLKSSLQKFYGCHWHCDLVNCYRMSVSQMTTDMLS